MNAKFFEEQRQEMVAAIRAIAEHIAAELGEPALDERVLSAMAKVPRREFVPIEVQQYAYLNRPIPIGQYYVAVDRQLKSRYGTYEAAEKAARKLKRDFQIHKLASSMRRGSTVPLLNNQ